MCEIGYADTHCFEETFFLAKLGNRFYGLSLERLRLRVIFGLSGVLDRGRLEGGLVKIEVGASKL